MAIITDGVRTKFTDDTGLPLIGGQVFSYVEGTNTPKDTYQDRAFTIPNTNPIILDDAGSCQMYLNGGYHLRALTANGVLVEEKDNAFQSDGQVLDVVANTTAIAALKTNVEVLNTRGGLKTDEHNFIIAHGRAESPTVYDPVFRADKLKLALQGQEDSARNIFKTYATDTTLDGNEIKAGTYLDPELQAVKLGTAATEDVGIGASQIPLNSNLVNAMYETEFRPVVGSTVSYSNMSFGAVIKTIGVTTPEAPNTKYTAYYNQVVTRPSYGDYGKRQDNYAWNGGMYSHSFRVYSSVSGEIKWTDWYVYWGSNNTDIHGTNGYLKPSSPILKIEADKMWGNDDGERMGAEYVKNGVGDYTIKNTTGLRVGDGWYVEIPNDMNGNPLCAITLDDKEGTINLKCYKRTFNMDKFIFEPDLENPLDVPEGRWIDLRFHDLPEEHLYEPIE